MGTTAADFGAICLERWHAMACCGMLWLAVVCCGMRWLAVACYGMRWRAMACDGKLWLVSGRDQNGRQRMHLIYGGAKINHSSIKLCFGIEIVRLGIKGFKFELKRLKIRTRIIFGTLVIDFRVLKQICHMILLFLLPMLISQQTKKGLVYKGYDNKKKYYILYYYNCCLFV